MRKVSVTLSQDAVIGDTDPRLFGAFIHLTEPMPLELALEESARMVLAGAQQLRHDDLNAVNTRDEPDKIAPAPLEGVSVNANRITATLAPASWNVIRLRRGD